MPETRSIPVSNLLLDFENPRLGQGQASQSETIHAMLRAEGAKTLALAEDISTEGLSPMDRLIVTPSAGEPKQFIVLEGNRRVTALKILAEPALAETVLTPAQQKRLRKWSEAYRARGEVAATECVIFGNRDDANVWIERRHRGDLGGLGVVRWGATEAARFDARRSGGKYAPELQVLDFVSEHAALPDDVREKLHDVPITNLERLISDKAVRDRIGLEIDKQGRVRTKFPRKETLKALTRIIRDLVNDEIKVRDIYSATDRKKYLDKFGVRDLPAISTARRTQEPLVGEAADHRPRSGSPTTKLARTTKQRATIIPSTCALHIDIPKLSDIYRELRKLKLEHFPNAIAVLLRVFLELSVDHALGKDKWMTAEQIDKSKLRDKVHKVASELEKAQRLTPGQAKAAKKAAQDQYHLSTSVITFHQYVHNEHFSASPTDLRVAWNNLQPFFEAIWHAKGK